MKNKIRQKLILYFMITTLLMVVVTFYTYINARILTLKMNTMFISNVNLKDFKGNLNIVERNLEKFLETKHYSNLSDYLSYSSELKIKSAKMESGSLSEDSSMLLEDIKNMVCTYIDEADNAIQAKRGRNIQQTVEYYNEAIKVYEYINAYIEKLNNRQLQENTERYLSFSKKINVLQVTNIFVLIGVVIFNFILIMIFSFKITKPIIKLSKAAESVSEGNFEIGEIKVNTDDEISVMAEAFNRMISSIKIYISEIREKAKLKALLKDAELKALQAQINPHFIFNTLNAGTQLAVLEGADKTAVFIENVANLVRYNIRKFDKPVKLSDEIKNIETYLSILKARFGDRIKYYVQTDAKALNVEMPCMILQPIVENAFVHGVSELECIGEIKISVKYTDKFVIISVKDNGKGMSKETLKNILNSEIDNKDVISKYNSYAGNSSGVGLSNVINRLRLFFGRADVIEIYSTIGVGSEFIIKIPIVLE